jgi:hypothetical protein
MTNKTMANDSLIPIEQKNINGECVNTVNARDLHEKFGSKHSLSNRFKSAAELEKADTLNQV